MTRVLLAALSAISRVGLESLLRDQADVDVVASTTGANGLEPLIEEHQPDLVVLEWDETDDLPPDLAVPLLLLSATPPAPDVLRSGSVRGVLSRETTGGELSVAIQAAARGLVVLPLAYLDGMLAAPASNPREPSAQTLSPREIEVLRMLADGLGNKQIAYRLSISEHTVKFHVASIMNKLRAGSRTEAVTLGIRQGMILL